MTELKKKRAFRKFSYRGVDLDQYVPHYLQFLAAAASNAAPGTTY